MPILPQTSVPAAGAVFLVDPSDGSVVDTGAGIPVALSAADLAALELVGIKGADGAAIASAANGVPVTPANGLSLTDASIANATGASETIAAASANRKKLIVSNPSASVSWWINPAGGTAVANTAGSFELPPGAMWAPSPAPTNAVTGIATLNTDLTVVVG